MSHGNIVASGQLTDGQSITLTERTSHWQILQHATGTSATATFDDVHVIHLQASLYAYTTISGNYQKLTATTNTVAYIAYG